jgi:1-acyl-sn-glycerol-3-phosphate acyltransferase
MADRPKRTDIAAAPHPDVDLVTEAQVVDRQGQLVAVSRRDRPTAARHPEEYRRSDVDAWGRSEHLRELTRRLYDPIYKHWFRVEWEHFDRLPKTGGALLVANHAGAIPPDAPAIMHGIETELDRTVYGLAENLFRSMPVIGTLWARGGGVAAHPATGKRFTERYQLHRFGRGGFVEIAMRAGVPVIPIAVVGAEEAMPIVFKSSRAAKLLGLPYFPVTANMLMMGPLGLVGYLPSKFRLRVLPPVHFDVSADQERYSRSRVMDESERIRQTVQEALYDMLRTRRSVWFG